MYSVIFTIYFSHETKKEMSYVINYKKLSIEKENKILYYYKAIPMKVVC
jgi:hypothetical protein